MQWSIIFVQVRCDFRGRVNSVIESKEQLGRCPQPAAAARKDARIS